MPELPEVETVRRQLNHVLAGATIKSVQLLQSGRETPVGKAFVKAVMGKKIREIGRRAKVLIWEFIDQTFLLAHLKMTGSFVFVPSSYIPQKHDHAVFLFQTKKGLRRLVWSDIRKFGYVKFVDDKVYQKVISEYGPEPLEVSAEVLANRLVSKSKRTLKAALLDQRLIAGVGNIYADEVCYRAKIRPTRRLASLTATDRLLLAEQIKQVLSESVAQQGTSANDYVDTNGEPGGFLEFLRVYDRKDQPCLTCKTPIKKIVLVQRGTHFCPKCQS